MQLLNIPRYRPTITHSKEQVMIDEVRDTRRMAKKLVGRMMSMVVLVFACAFPVNAQGISGPNRSELINPIIQYGKAWTQIPESQRQKLLSDYNQRMAASQIDNGPQSISAKKVGKSAVAVSEDWTQIGPKGGEVYKIAIDQTNSDIVYATARGGIYKSTNGGGTWNNLYATSVYSNSDIMIAPTDPSLIYGIADSNLYVSNDAGASWTGRYINVPTGYVSGYALQIDPEDPSKVYVSGYRHDATTGTNYLVICISSDSGLTWVIHDLFMMDSNYFGTLEFLSFVPGNSDELFAGGYYYDGSNERTVVYKSINRGDDWESVFESPAGYYNSLYDMAIDPETGTVLLCGNFCDAAGGNNIYRSSNSGATWELTNLGISYIDNFTFDKTGSILYVVLNATIFSSTDKGATWSPGFNFMQGDNSRWVNTIVVDPSDSQSLYIGSCRGFYKSTNGGGSCQEINDNFYAWNIVDMAVDPVDTDIIYIATPLLYRSADGGATWSFIDGPYAQSPNSIVIDPRNHRNVYVAGASQFWWSSDEGIGWESYDVMIDSATWGQITSIDIDSNDGSLYGLGGYINGEGNYQTEIFKSADQGTTWSVAGYPDISTGNINVIKAGSTAGVLYAGGGIGDSSTEPVVFRSDDYGDSWSKWDISASFQYGIIHEIAVLPTGKVLAGGYAYDDDGCSFLFTSTNGINWSITGESQWNVSISSLAYDPTSSLLIAGGFFDSFQNGFYSTASVFSSNDGGVTWIGEKIYDEKYVNTVEVTRQNKSLSIYDATQVGLFRSIRTEQTLTVSEAADANWINRYAYTFDGSDYVIIDPDDDTPIPAWQGFWTILNKSVDLLIPEDTSAPTAPSSMDIVMQSNKWYLTSAPLDPGAGNRELSSIFSSLGRYESTWRGIKWDYTYSGTSDTDGYQIFQGPGLGFPEMLPGRGFWVKQINNVAKTVTLAGSPVSTTDGNYELRLPANFVGTTAHMVGNPYWYPIRWGDMMIRKPSTGSAPLGKNASLSSGAVEKWFVGIKVEALDGSARDMYNRAGVITTTGVDSKLFNARDLIPPDSFVNINLKDPSDQSRDGLAYDFRAAGQEEYQWELDLSTSFASLPVKLSLDNLLNTPKGTQFTLKDMTGGETISLDGDQSFSLTLTSGSTHKYLLTARMDAGSTVVVNGAHPVPFGFTGASPNPFNPSTTINFGLEKTGTVKLSVYNINGQIVDTIAEGMMTSGKHSVAWSAKGNSSGVYLVVLDASGKRDTMKVSLVK